MRSPVVAMLWENWQLTRVEAAFRLALGIVMGSAVLAGFTAVAPNEAVMHRGASTALGIIVLFNFPIWQSIARLTGGRFLEGYRPGFPLHLHYARPVRTVVLVGVPAVYDAVSSAALYLISAALLRVTFSYPFPLLNFALWIAAVHLVQSAAQWSTRSRVVQWVGAMAAGSGFFALALYRGQRWPVTQFDFSLAEHAVMVSVGLASFGLMVAGVARQRHGDAPAAIPRAAVSGFADSLVGLFRFSCPTSSAMRAQLWFDVKSSGLPLLTIGLAFALTNLLLFVAGGRLEFVRQVAVVFTGVSVFAVLSLGGNAFGIRRKHGGTYSVFEATQAYETGQLACVKVLVRSACVLAALIAVGVTLWASVSLASAWDEFGPGMLRVQRTIEAVFVALTGYEVAALAIVTALGVVVMVAFRAALAALHARYPRPLKMTGSLLLLYVLALVLLAMASQRGIGFELPIATILRTTLWTLAVAIVLATVYLFSRVFAERLMSLRQAGGIVLISTVFVTAWLTLLRAAGVQLAVMSATDAVWMLSPILLALMTSALAPWSLGRVRHA